MTGTLFLLLHGSFGNPDENWLPDLREQLRRLGQKVITPALPVDDYDSLAGPENTKQNLVAWLEAMEQFKSQLHDTEKLVIVAHSLGPLFALHLILKFELKVDCLISVCPFLEIDEVKGSEKIDWVNRTFYKDSFDTAKLTESLSSSYVLYSNNDPYVPADKSLKFAKLTGASTIPLRGTGHTNSAVGMSSFPLVLELCKSRLDLTIYQRYISHRLELFSDDTARYNSESEIIIHGNETNDEGIFKFRNLQKFGLCTLPSDSNIWEPQSVYMKESRRAAKRLGTVKRLIIVKNLSDLQRPVIKEQIDLDVGGGMQVFMSDPAVLKTYDGEIDFGIWDDEYVCVVNEGTDTTVRMSSHKDDIERAHKWWEVLMEGARPAKI